MTDEERPGSRIKSGMTMLIVWVPVFTGMTSMEENKNPAVASRAPAYS